MDCSSYVVVSLLIFFYFVPVLDTLLYNMADGLVVLFAHSAFGIGLCPVDCCFYMICSYCLILCCNINKRLCMFLFKALFPSTKSMFHRVFDLHSVSQTARIMACLSILGDFQFSSCV